MAKPLVIAFTFSAALAGAAQAQTAAPATPQTATRADVDRKLDEGFNRVDVNNDGFLGREEVAAAGARAVQQAQENVESRVEQEFKRIDSDKNNQISLAEFKAAAKVRANLNPEEALQRLDSNKDGKISPAEFKAKTLAQFDQVDTNKDGKVTPEEQAKAKAR